MFEEDGVCPPFDDGDGEGGGPGVRKPVWGSGYPSDPKTVAWLRTNTDPVFGYPRIVRFSWQTCVKLVHEFCERVTWQDEDDGDGGGAGAGKKAGRDIRLFFARKRLHDDDTGKPVSQSSSSSSPAKECPVQVQREVWIREMVGLKPVLSL